MRRLPLVESRSARLQSVPARPDGFAEQGIPPLTDARGRVYRYLRLSLTDRCDLACIYCMPPGGEEDHAARERLLRFEEITRLAAVFAAGGVERIRFTGGEPLVRKGAVQLVERVHDAVPSVALAMTSNGTRLAELAEPLARAGLRSVNVSLDTLDAHVFAELTRGGEIGRVLAGIHAALDAGLEVKLNIVPLRGVNDAGLGDLVDWSWSLGITPRFIELMPLGEAAKLPAVMRMNASAVRGILGDRAAEQPAEAPAGPLGPARYIRGQRGRIGFITAMSDEFCESCNRVRITARGDVRACLADRQAVSLRDVMRDGGADADVAWALHWALAGKARGHGFTDATVSEHEHVGMSLIGG